MYFSNITDNELLQFHNTVKNNFNMRLLDVLTSDLFKIEEITPEIYKIYPLFYCETIESNNKDDKILENKCVICKKDSNTRLYFNTPPSKDDVDLGFTSAIVISPYGLAVFNGNSAFVFFDKETGRLLEGVKVTANLKSNNKWYSDEGYTNKEGIVYLPALFGGYMFASGYFNAGTIVAEYKGVTTTLWEKLE